MVEYITPTSKYQDYWNKHNTFFNVNAFNAYVFCINFVLTGLNVMTGILVSKSRYQNSKTLSLSPSLENRAAKVFQQRSWLNDLSLPLLLMLAGSLTSRPAHAQQETPLNDIAVTAQNQFGTARQLLIKDGVLYLIEDGCNLVMIRWMAGLVLTR